MDGPHEIIGGKKQFKDAVEFIARQAAHVADGKTDYATPDLDTEAEIIVAINAINVKINAILLALENIGAFKSA